METFDDIKKYFALLGITSHESTRKKVFNAIIVLIFITHGIDLILSFVYISKVADNFGEYVDAFFRITSLIACIIFLATIVWDLPQLHKFVCNLENYISKSE